MYDRQVTGNLERLQQTYESWAQTYPRDPEPYGLWAGFAATSSGQFEPCVKTASQSIALDPDGTPSYASLAFCHLYLGRLTEAEAAVDRALKRKLEMSEFFMMRYFVTCRAESRTRVTAIDHEQRRLIHIEPLSDRPAARWRMCPPCSGYHALDTKRLGLARAAAESSSSATTPFCSEPASVTGTRSRGRITRKSSTRKLARPAPAPFGFALWSLIDFVADFS